ncbi:MAG: HD domain-containing protein [Bacilli bacterium]
MEEKINYELVKESFNNYLSFYDLNNSDISLKKRHSYAVADLMCELAYLLGMNDDEIILAKTIGLLHDIGRFEQLRLTSSYKDKVFDHAEYSNKYLFIEGHIRDFIKTDRYDDIIKEAIFYHNKLTIPDEVFCYTKMIRDTDKIDIYYQCAVNFEYRFDSNISPKVISEFNACSSINLDFVETGADKVLSILSLIFDINYLESFKLLTETDNFYLFVGCIEVDSTSESLWSELTKKCVSKIEGGI